MATISSIKGISDAELTRQVEGTARLEPVPEKQIQPDQLLEIVKERQVRQQKNSSDSGVTQSDPDNYAKTLEVANKLQDRIDELASAPHKVTIRTDEDSSRFIIEIQDPEGEVVKQFPSEKVLNLHRKLDDLSGMVIDEMI